MNRYIFSFLLILFLLLSCGDNNSEKNELERPVRVGKVYKSLENRVDEISGVIVSKSEANPSFSVHGLLQKIYVKEGDYVKKGELLAEIDSKDYISVYEAAESKFNQVSGEVARVEELYKRNSVAKNDYEKALSGLQSVSSMYQSAKNNLQNTKLYSPISGIVQKINAGLYQTIMPGLGVLTIVNSSELNVETNISALMYFKRDNFISFWGHSPFVGEPIPLKMVYIAPKANNNQLYKMVLTIDEKYQKKLAPGMTLAVDVVNKSNKEQEISVLLKSVFLENNESYVWKVDTVNSTIKKQKIRVGNVNDEARIVVFEGLSEDDIVVTAGVSKLEDNQKIKILK